MISIIKRSFLLLLIYLIPIAFNKTVNGQTAVKDSTIELLMAQNKFKEASQALEIKLTKSNNLPVNLVLYYTNRLSYAFFCMRNIDMALNYARHSLYLSKQSSDSALISDAWKVAAYSYNHFGKLDSALCYSDLMYRYALRKGDDKVTGNALSSVASILNQSKRYPEALKYFREVMKLRYKNSDSLTFAGANYNLGLTFLNMGQTDSSLFYLHKAAFFAKKSEHKDVLIYAYGTLADCYMVLKDNENWKKYLIQANQIAEQIGNKQFLAMGYSNLTSYSIQNKDYTNAIGYGIQAIDLLKDSHFPVLKQRVDSMLYVSYKYNGQFIKALTHLESSDSIKNLLNSSKQKELLNELVVRLDLKEKDLKIADQRLTILQRDSELNILIFITLLLAIISVAMIIYFIRSRKYRHELFLKERFLEKQLDEIDNYSKWKYKQGDEETDNIIVTDTTQEILNSAPVIQKKKSDLFSELRDLCIDQKIYLNPDLNIEMVVQQLGTNKKYLYEAISTNSDDNFRSLINFYRVGEAKKIIEEMVKNRKDLNLTDLSAQAGFSSSVSFYRTFKSITGLTPKEFKTEVLKNLQ